MLYTEDHDDWPNEGTNDGTLLCTEEHGMNEDTEGERPNEGEPKLVGMPKEGIKMTRPTEGQMLNEGMKMTRPTEGQMPKEGIKMTRPKEGQMPNEGIDNENR